jgi:hypothetical protein
MANALKWQSMAMVRSSLLTYTIGSIEKGLGFIPKFLMKKMIIRKHTQKLN